MDERNSFAFSRSPSPPTYHRPQQHCYQCRASLSPSLVGYFPEAFLANSAAIITDNSLDSSSTSNKLLLRTHTITEADLPEQVSGYATSKQK